MPTYQACFTCGRSYLRSELRAGKNKSGPQCIKCAPDAKSPLASPIRPAPKMSVSLPDIGEEWWVVSSSDDRASLLTRAFKFDEQQADGWSSVDWSHLPTKTQRDITNLISRGYRLQATQS